MSAAAPRGAPLVANARMYAVNDDVAELWRRLFEWVAADSGVALQVVAHAAPAPLERLWQRDDLGCAFICGYPLAAWADPSRARPRVLAAPLPSPPRYGGRAVYCTDIVVRTDAPYNDANALRGARFGSTVEHSQSGFHAPRHFFSQRPTAADGRFFGSVVGPLQTPRRIVDAVLDGRIDAGPIDSWWHDLLRRHEPATAAQLRTLASTPLTPLPPLVAAATTPAESRRRLAASLLSVASADALADVRRGLLLDGFAPATAAAYRVLLRHARRTDATAYREPG
ncbi:MAG: PhnD/SsuA/transferrin family substrate-binding protein [Betaproteobacteria bacterium]